MDKNTWSDLKTIFYKAYELNESEREAFIDKNCSDPEIKKEVLSLLSAHDKSEKFMESTHLLNQSEKENSAFFIGKYFGRYKVEKLIAKGGMGLVFLGVRDDEVKQNAAVKIINPGVASGTVIKRFQNERQTLANLNHPNISRLLDGGITDDGIQFLVMEYIEGIPIDEYCDKKKLNTKERLVLFLKVAAAVRYAHQNLVVHRDLKPNNILITENGEPKLLDFGIAKILSPGEESDTLTHKGMWNLTPEYASPEQIKGESITTSSDVYSLGIILYKLLTGHNPYRIKSVFHQDISRIITQTEPVKPSEVIYQTIEKISDEETTRITPDTISVTREGSVDKLHKKLKGDLDNIVSMAIRKEVERRYSSIEHFAEDVERFLNDKPVKAHEDSWAYRTKKFIKRNKAAVIPAAIIFIIINLGLAGILWQGHLAAKERDTAKLEAEKSNRIKSFLLDMISAPDPRKEGKEVKVIDVINKASGKLQFELSRHPQIEAEIRTMLGNTYQNLGIYNSAESEMNKALEINKKLFGGKSKETAMSLKNLGLVYHYEGDYEKTEQFYNASLEMLKEIEETPSFERALVLDAIGSLMTDKGDYEKAEVITKQALTISESIKGPEDPDVAQIKNNLATSLNYLDKLDEADSLYREALRVFRKHYGNYHIQVSRVINNLAFISIFKKEHDKAIPLLEEALNIKIKVLGEDHPDLILAYSNVGSTYHNIGVYDKAEKYMKASVDAGLKNFDENNVNLSRSYMWYGRALEGNGKYEEGIFYLNKAYEIRRNEFGDKNNLTLTTQLHLGKCLGTAKKYNEAEKQLLQCYSGFKEISGTGNENTNKTLSTLVDLYNSWGKKKEADYYSQLIAK
ncbi:MAG: serine/threonine protein kinase [Ignavibacteriales bacterium]|nr:MAG: serine/threonine protein kinase [Ignavibacteriales bacterium]